MIRTKCDSGEIFNTSKKRSREFHPRQWFINVIRTKQAGLHHRFSA